MHAFNLLDHVGGVSVVNQLGYRRVGEAICMLPSTTLTISDIKPALTPEPRKSINQKFSLFQLVPCRPTDDEVVHSKRLGNKVIVDLYRYNPLIVI